MVAPHNQIRPKVALDRLNSLFIYRATSAFLMDLVGMVQRSFGERSLPRTQDLLQLRLYRLAAS